MGIARRLAVGMLICIGLGAVTTPDAAAQSLSRVQRERGVLMLRQVRADLDRYFYDASFKGLDLTERFRVAEERIRSAGSHPEMLGAIAEILFDLEDSHTFFVPPDLTVQVDYGWDMQFVGDTCIVTEVTSGSDAERQGIAPGDVIVSVNGNTPTRENLWKLTYLYHMIRPQPGLRVVVQTPGTPSRQLDVEARIRERKRILDLTGGDGGNDIWQLIRDMENDAARFGPRYVSFGDSLLIWKLPAFSDRYVKEGLRRLRGKRALVLDLRGNGGGAQDALLELLGAFYEQDLVIGTLAQRSRTDRLVAKGAGRGAFDGEVVVLVDSRSASASEVFGRMIMSTDRGRVIGDRTSGSVMRSQVRSHNIGSNVVVAYGMSVSDANVIFGDGSSLEGTGLTPHLMLPVSADFAARRDPVLSHAAGLLGVKLAPERAWTLLRAR